MPGNQIESIEFDVDNIAATTGEILLELSPGSNFNGARIKRTKNFGIGEVDVHIRTLGATAESGGDIDIVLGDQDDHEVNLGNRREAGAQGMRVLMDLTAPSASGVTTITTSITGATFTAGAFSSVARPDLLAYPVWGDGAANNVSGVISNIVFTMDFDPPGTYPHDNWQYELQKGGGAEFIAFGSTAGQGAGGVATGTVVGPITLDGQSHSSYNSLFGIDTNWIFLQSNSPTPTPGTTETITLSYDRFIDVPTVVTNASGSLNIDLHYEPKS